jgi:signal transduction histidine kinase
MESGTGLMHKIKNNHFLYARLRLTILYTIVTMTIVILFSLALFISLDRNSRSLIDDDQSELVTIQNHKFRSGIEDIENTIIYIDFFLLFLISGLGYLIAGKTLNPIKKNIEIQKRFLADASHDLRTPLAIMKSESQVLVQGNSQNINEYKQVVKSNIEEINKMTNLVEDLLLIARNESIRSKTISNEDIDLQKLIEKLISRMKSESNKKNIIITIEGTVTSSIKGNANNLERAIQNILQNAINYTPNGGKITVSLIQEKDSCSIKVSDTGVGIKESDLPYVFDRFYKAEHSRNDASGSGLGLPIAKQIIEQHSGTIKIASKPNNGIEVIILIPLV